MSQERTPTISIKMAPDITAKLGPSYRETKISLVEY